MNANHQAKVHELIDSLAAEMKVDCERLYRSGGIDVTEYNPDEYVLAKILVTATMKRNQGVYSPIFKEGQNAVKNLEHF